MCLHLLVKEEIKILARGVFATPISILDTLFFHDRERYNERIISLLSSSTKDIYLNVFKKAFCSEVLGSASIAPSRAHHENYSKWYNFH